MAVSELGASEGPCLHHKAELDRGGQALTASSASDTHNALCCPAPPPPVWPCHVHTQRLPSPETWSIPETDLQVSTHTERLLVRPSV